jgi:hypothetical protein
MRANDRLACNWARTETSAASKSRAAGTSIGAPPTYQPTESDQVDVQPGVERHDRAVDRLPTELVDDQTGRGQNAHQAAAVGAAVRLERRGRVRIDERLAHELLDGQSVAGPQAQIDRELRKPSVAPADELPPARDDRVCVVDGVRVRPLLLAEVHIARDRCGGEGLPGDMCRVQLLDLVRDALQRVGVDIGVVECQIYAGGVLSDDRRVDEIGPVESIRRVVEAVLQMLGQQVPVGEVAHHFAVERDIVPVESEPVHLVAHPSEPAAQRLVAQCPAAQGLFQRVEVDLAGQVESRTEPGRHEQAPLAHRPRRSDV